MFVTGCHRSGTSLLSSVIRQCAGFDSTSHDDLPSALDNPAGFHESTLLKTFNDDLLALIGCTWRNPPLVMPQWHEGQLLSRLESERPHFQNLALDHKWVHKDPRLCLTYPAYLHLFLRSIPIVASIRDPLSVAGSLFARDGIPINAGLCLWYIYNHHLSSCLQQDDPLIPYKSILSASSDPDVSEALYSKISVWFQKNNFSSFTFNVWSDIISSHVQPSLDRSSSSVVSISSPLIIPELQELCQQAYHDSIGTTSNGDSLRSSFSSLPRLVLDVQAQFGISAHVDVLEPARLRCVVDELDNDRNQLSLRISELDSQISSLLIEKNSLNSQLNAILASKCWRLSSPIRWLMNLFRK